MINFRLTQIDKNGVWALSLALSIGLLASLPSCADVPKGGPSKAGEQASERLTARQLESLIMSGKTGCTSKVTSLTGTGPTVWITAQREAEATEKNMKIDAVLLAKALVTAAGKQVDAVDVVFSEEGGKNGRQVTVKKAEIEAYGHGLISVDQLLASLVLESVRPKQQIEVEPGPELARRLLLRQRIEKLREQGTGIKPFEAIFQEIEGLVKAGEQSKAAERLTFLENRVDGQEEQLKQAKLKARGLGGVPATPGSYAQSQTSTTASGSHQGSSLPSDYQRVLGVFQRDADNIIRQVENKDRSAGARLRQNRTQADALIKQNKISDAFRYIGEFHQGAISGLGYDPFSPTGGQGGPGGGQGGPMQGGPMQGGPPGGGPPGGGPPGGFPGGGPPGGGGFGPPP